jgi:hypothetical protein
MYNPRIEILGREFDVLQIETILSSIATPRCEPLYRLLKV